MKRIVFSAALLAGLTGCASLPNTAGDQVVDEARVAQVERAAAYGGARVYWVQMPLKRVSGSGS